MIRIKNIENCLSKIYSIGRFHARNLLNLEKPVHSIRLITSVWPGYSGIVTPAGCIYSVEFTDGKQREIFVWGNPADRDYESAIFIAPGRQGDKLREVLNLSTVQYQEPVSEFLIEKLRDYDGAREHSDTNILQFG